MKCLMPIQKDGEVWDPLNNHRSTIADHPRCTTGRNNIFLWIYLRDRPIVAV